MKNSKILVRLIALMMALAMTLALFACGKKDEGAKEDNGSSKTGQQEEQEQQKADYGTGEEMTEAGIASLMDQVAKDSFTFEYKDFMPDEGFASAEIFDVTKDGDTFSAHSYLETGEYVVIKDKAYFISGSAGEVILKYTFGEGPELKEIVWSADGSAHEKWIKDNFTEKAIEGDKAYLKANGDGVSALTKKIEEAAAEKMGVPVELENFLQINDEEGTYEIYKVLDEPEDTEENKFETETIEKGKLKDLK